MKVVLGFAFLYVLLVAFLARKKLHELHPRKFFLETWLAADREAAMARADRMGEMVYRSGAVSRPMRFDWHAVVAYVTLAVVLTLQEYFGDRASFDRLRDRGWVIEWGGGPNRPPTHHLKIFGPLRWLTSERWGELYGLSWWVFTRWIGYVVIPVLIVWIWRKRLRDFGLSFKGFLSHAWIYALFFGIVLIAVVLVSNTSEFANYYPFYRQANRSWRDFWTWELLYASQFLALEFFFRGFLIFSGRRSMGAGVIVAMVVPYCMIHYGKPWAEAMAAILAGVVLGTLSLKTRSIWSGFLIHVTVAISMDMAALVQTRGLPGGFHLPASWGF